MVNKPQKKCSISLNIMETQVKTTKRYHLALIRMTTIKNKTKAENNKCWQGYGEIEPLCTVGENVKWCSCCSKWYGNS